MTRSSITSHWKSLVTSALLLLLAGFILTRGVVPAFSRIDSDFPSYFTAARIVVEGGPTARLYDDAWFQQQLARVFPERPRNAKFSPLPPPTALLQVPFASLSPLTALRVTTVISLLALVCSIGLIARIVPLTVVQAAVFVLLSGYAVCNSLRFGQPYILVSTACLLGYYAWTKHRPLLAGACIGLFVPIKYFPIVILIYFAARGQWRVVAGGAASATAVVLLGIAVLGWPVHQTFLASVLGNHLVGNLSLQDPFSASFQSFDSLFRRLFVFDSGANPHPWIVMPGLQVIAVAMTKATLLAVAIITIVRLTRADPANSAAPAIGLLGVLVLLIAPATASYHFVLLWLPVGLLLGWLWKERAYGHGWLVLGLYAFLSFIPYGHLAPFEGRGVLTVLAYPRLAVMLALFLVASHSVWNPGPRVAQPV